MPTKSVKGTASTHKVVLLDIISYTLGILHQPGPRPRPRGRWAQAGRPAGAAPNVTPPRHARRPHPARRTPFSESRRPTRPARPRGAHRSALYSRRAVLTQARRRAGVQACRRAEAPAPP